MGEAGGGTSCQWRKPTFYAHTQGPGAALDCSHKPSSAQEAFEEGLLLMRAHLFARLAAFVVVVRSVIEIKVKPEA